MFLNDNPIVNRMAGKINRCRLDSAFLSNSDWFCIEKAHRVVSNANKVEKPCYNYTLDPAEGEWIED